MGDVQALTNPAPTVQSNFEQTERQAFQLRPSQQSGVDTTIQGPPTTGAWQVGDLWRDALLGVWRCTVAGTPGTWRQQAAAVVVADPTGTLATGYRITRVDGSAPRNRIWDGAVWKEAGLWGNAITSQAAAIVDATGGATVDAEARTAINALLAACRAAGLIAP